MSGPHAPSPAQIIECVLCRKKKEYRQPYSTGGSEISAWSKVCNDCEAFWELGKKAAKATKADGKEMRASAPSEVPVHPKMGDPKASVVVKGTDIMAALGGISLRGTARGDTWRDGVENYSIVELQDRGDWTYVGGQSVTFTAPKARIVAMQRIVAGFLNAIAKARVDGFNEGRNLLTGLASGSVSLESFSEQADNARAGRKPKKRWGDS